MQANETPMFVNVALRRDAGYPKFTGGLREARHI